MENEERRTNDGRRRGGERKMEGDREVGEVGKEYKKRGMESWKRKKGIREYIERYRKKGKEKG